MNEAAQKPGSLTSEDASPWLRAWVGPRPLGAPPGKGTPSSGVPGKGPQCRHHSESQETSVSLEPTDKTITTHVEGWGRLEPSDFRK